MSPQNEYPGLEAIARKAFEAAREKLPPDVGIGVLFSFHYGEANTGGLAWVAGTRREDAIGMVTEWLAEQAAKGHAETVRAAMEKWFVNRGEKP